MDSKPNFLKIFKIINLMLPLELETEVYPGDPKPQRHVFSDIDDGWEHYVHEVGDHNFMPHGDAPKHQNQDRQSDGFEFFDSSFCFNQACLIDLSGVSEAKERDGIKYLIAITKNHLLPYVELIPKRGAVIIRTGYDKWLEANKAHIPENIPYFTKEAAEFIASFDNLKVIGIDSITVDPVGKHDSHQALKDLLIVESLPYLGCIPKSNRNEFIFQSTPIKIKGATGGPIAAYAFITQ